MGQTTQEVVQKMNKILFALSFLFVGGVANAVDQVQMYSVRTTDAFQTSVTQFVVSDLAGGRAFRTYVANTDVALTVSITGANLATALESSTITIASGAKYVRIALSGAVSTTDFLSVSNIVAGSNPALNCTRATASVPFVLPDMSSGKYGALTLYVEASSPALKYSVVVVR